MENAEFKNQKVNTEVAKCSLMLLKALAHEWIGSGAWSLAKDRVERELELEEKNNLKETLHKVMEFVLNEKEPENNIRRFME